MEQSAAQREQVQITVGEKLKKKAAQEQRICAIGGGSVLLGFIGTKMEFEKETKQGFLVINRTEISSELQEGDDGYGEIQYLVELNV